MSDGYIEIDDDEDDFDDDLIIGDTSSGSDGSYYVVFSFKFMNHSKTCLKRLLTKRQNKGRNGKR